MSGLEIEVLKEFQDIERTIMFMVLFCQARQPVGLDSRLSGEAVIRF